MARGCIIAHEVHPSEIAYDYWTSVRTLEAIGHREAFGVNWDPTHMVWQGLDTVGFIVDFADRIYHVDCKDAKVRPKTGRAAASGRIWRGAIPGGGGTSSRPVVETCPGKTH